MTCKPSPDVVCYSHAAVHTSGTVALVFVVVLLLATVVLPVLVFTISERAGCAR